MTTGISSREGNLGISNTDVDTLPPAVGAKSRLVRFRELEVLQYEPLSNQSEMRLVRQGIITVLLARQDSNVFADIREAVEKRGTHEQNIVTRIQKPFGFASLARPSELMEMHQAQPVLADILYGGMPLASNLFIPDGLDFCAVDILYNGGRLARTGFNLVEHYIEGTDTALDALILTYSPPLSEIELAALRQLPAEEIRRETAVPAPGVVPAIAAAFFVGIAVGWVAHYAWTKFRGGRELDAYRVPEAVIQELGPRASADQLLQMRRSVLVDQG